VSRVIVVSNRLPDLEDDAGGHGVPGVPAGGLASAMFAALRGTRSPIWFGWNGRTRSETTGSALTVRTAAGVRLIGMPLTTSEVEHYYHGFANSALWPLFHCFTGRVQLDLEDELSYRRVQRRFAVALLRLLRPDDLVWVNDYHLLLLARELRARGWRGATGFFLHVPFPPRDLFRVLPDPKGFLEGMLDYDLVGFHVRDFLDNYVQASTGEAGARHRKDELRFGDRVQRVGVFPVGIDPEPFRPARDGTEGPEPSSMVRAARGRRVVLGVDRLDYTKGIPERMLAFEQLLRTRPRWRREVTLVQIAAPSRTRVRSYLEHKKEIDELVGRLNGELAEEDWIPIRYFYRAYPREVLARNYRDADVGLVTPLRDGMNLVAKEFIAAQTNEDPGVLVLSRFAGAAEELPEAVIVNPYVPADTVRGLEQALSMSLPERRNRHKALLARVLRGTADDWARRFLAALRSSGRARPVQGRLSRLFLG